jgi:CDP-glucose 4,6-dehydratase
MLGANVVGYALEPNTNPSHFIEIGLRDRIAHVRGDIRDLNRVKAAISEYKPDFIFHLAAQPLVLLAYKEPRETIETNVMGTVNLLEAMRDYDRKCVLIMVTTDKVYENAGWIHSYRETDPLGGFDPYSAGKACAELCISSYMRSFFASPQIAAASVRGGNVIGGGDWAEDRIVPDAMRALSIGAPLAIRNRNATRPWQHALELLAGYLHLGRLLYLRQKKWYDADSCLRDEALSGLNEIRSAFNFGPHITSNRTVGSLVEEIFKYWPGASQDGTLPNAPREAGKLNLTIDKSYHILGWEPKWSFEETVAHTVNWYRRFYSPPRKPNEIRDNTQEQIELYSTGLEYRVIA